MQVINSSSVLLLYVVSWLVTLLLVQVDVMRHFSGFNVVIHGTYSQHSSSVGILSHPVCTVDPQRLQGDFLR